MSCSVCTENFNKKARKQVSCSCGYVVCTSCTRQYILGKMSEASCMNCKRVFDRVFLSKTLGMSFINKEYKKHVKNILLEKEKALIPASLSHVERLKNDLKIKALRACIKSFYDLKMVEQLQTCLYKKNLLPSLYRKEEKVVKCKNGDCKGFLNKNWECIVCETISCKTCHGINDKDHKCDPDDVKTVQVLSKDTKPCPGCHVPIHKYIGCHQMFCVQCHTVFDWASGKVISGTVHNPHYFEWLKANGHLDRNILDIECGRILDHNHITMMIHLNMKNALVEKSRKVIHIHQVILPILNERSGVRSNLKERSRYIMGDLQEDEFKAIIYKREKSRLKNQQLGNIVSTYVRCYTDIIYIVLSSKKTTGVCKRINSLEEFVNVSLKDISKLYQSKEYKIETITKSFI